MRALAAAFVVSSFALLASGCGGSTDCNGSCPSIAADYAVQTSTLDRSCDFQPWLLPPTVTISQAGASSHVTLSVIDPANQVEVPLTAEMRVPNNGKAVAELEGSQWAQRQSGLASTDLPTVRITVSGSVTESNGRRWLELSLVTTELGSACMITQVLTAKGPPVSSAR